MAPRVLEHPGARPTGRIGTLAVDTREFSARRAHPSTEDHDDTLKAHYSCLERPHACIDGWVYLGRIVESEHDLDGEVVVYDRVPCRRCADSR